MLPPSPKWWALHLEASTLTIRVRPHLLLHLSLRPLIPGSTESRQGKEMSHRCSKCWKWQIWVSKASRIKINSSLGRLKLLIFTMLRCRINWDFRLSYLIRRSNKTSKDGRITMLHKECRIRLSMGLTAKEMELLLRPILVSTSRLLDRKEVSNGTTD